VPPLGVLRFPLLPPVYLFPGLLASSFPLLLVPSVQIVLYNSKLLSLVTFFCFF
jgi:hypothetical protein